MKYDIFFEIYGKKMKATILADNVNDAKERIKNKIIFHKIEVAKKEPITDIFSDLDDILSAFNKIK